MSQDAGLDIDYDAQLAELQRQATTLPGSEDAAPPVVVGTVVDDARTVEFMGKRFRIADKIGAMPLLKFSMYSDMAVQDPKAMAAMYAMLRDCIHPGTPACGECEHCAPERCGDCQACDRAADGDPDDLETHPCQVNPPDDTRCKKYDPGDWRAFEEHAIDTRADADDLLAVIGKTTELLAGRPTGPRSPSSGGRRAISRGSTARSSSKRARGSKR